MNGGGLVEAKVAVFLEDPESMTWEERREAVADHLGIELNRVRDTVRVIDR